MDIRTLLKMVCLLASFGASAQTDLPLEATDGFRFAANTLLLKTSSEPSSLPSVAPANDAEKKLVMAGNKIMSSGATKAALVSRNGQILFEQYSRSVSAESTPLAFSISKSLVAVAIGKALCDGSIKSLDDKAAVYVPDLKSTSYGDSTIAQLLMMTSGAYQGDFNTGHPEPSESFVLRNMYLPRGLEVDLLSRMKKFSGYQAPGVGFSYKNYDTIALTYVLEAATKTDFGTYFEKNVWLPSRPERTGAWLRNADKKVLGHAGFSAAPKDYLRIGYFLIDEMKKTDSCMAKYLTTATSNLVTPLPGRGYGYQIHKLSLRLAPASFWFLGYGGQLLGVDVPSGTVLYLYQGSDRETEAWVRASATMMGELR